MIRVACENPFDEGWLRRFLPEQGLPARMADRGEPWELFIDGAGNVSAGGQVVTCGVGQTNTVTASSLLDGGMAALQREMRGLDGSVILPREVSLEGLRGPVDRRLTEAAILLFFGKF